MTSVGNGGLEMISHKRIFSYLGPYCDKYGVKKQLATFVGLKINSQAMR